MFNDKDGALCSDKFSLNVKISRENDVNSYTLLSLSYFLSVFVKSGRFLLKTEPGI